MGTEDATAAAAAELLMNMEQEAQAAAEQDTDPWHGFTENIVQEQQDTDNGGVVSPMPTRPVPFPEGENDDEVMDTGGDDAVMGTDDPQGDAVMGTDKPAIQPAHPPPMHLRQDAATMPASGANEWKPWPRRPVLEPEGNWDRLPLQYNGPYPCWITRDSPYGQVNGYKIWIGTLEEYHTGSMLNNWLRESMCQHNIDGDIEAYVMITDINVAPPSAVQNSQKSKAMTK